MYDEVDFYLIDLKSKFDKIKLNTYYLSYSGGKDSHFLYWFIKEYLKRDDIKIVGINTYMEHHEILRRILDNSDIVLLPKMKPMEIKEKYGIPCFSKVQDEIIDRYQNGCRSECLMKRVKGYTYIGKDGQEYKSFFRLNNKARELLLNSKLHKVSNKSPPVFTVCRGGQSKGGIFTPIHDLSDELLDKIYQKYDIEIPDVYKYITRTGCMGCPYGSWKHDTEKELKLINKNQLNFVFEYFKESYEVLGIKRGDYIDSD